MASPTDTELIDSMRIIIQNADLDSVTFKVVLDLLTKQYGDLTERKAFLKAQVPIIIRETNGDNNNEAPVVTVEEKQEQEEASVVKQELKGGHKEEKKKEKEKKVKEGHKEEKQTNDADQSREESADEGHDSASESKEVGEEPVQWVISLKKTLKYKSYCWNHSSMGVGKPAQRVRVHLHPRGQKRKNLPRSASPRGRMMRLTKKMVNQRRSQRGPRSTNRRYSRLALLKF